MSGTWWLPRSVKEGGLLPDGSLDPCLRQGRGVLMGLVSSPLIDENGLVYLATPFALRVLDELTRGQVPPTPLMDHFLQQGGDIDRCCEYPGLDVRKFRYFFHQVSEKVQAGLDRRGLAIEFDPDAPNLDMVRAILWLVNRDDPADFLITMHAHDSEDTVDVREGRLDEDGEGTDVSFDDRTITREPVQQEAREVGDPTVSPELSSSKEAIDRLIEDMLYYTAFSMYLACAIDVVYGDRSDTDIDIVPLLAQTVGGELLQRKPQTVDIPSPGFHALKSEASAASFAGGLSPPPCKPAGGVTRDRSFQRNMGDRGGTCHAPCGGGGGQFFDYHHIHERPAPRAAFNRVGIG